MRQAIALERYVSDRSLSKIIKPDKTI